MRTVTFAFTSVMKLLKENGVTFKGSQSAFQYGFVTEKEICVYVCVSYKE